MATGAIILVVIVLVIIAVAATLASMVIGRRAARRRATGPEFGRLARETGPRRARAVFASRQRRVDGMGIKPIPDERRSGYARQWMTAQEQFIDNPSQAAAAAARLVTAVAAERGYDVSDPSQLLVDLSVYHGRYLDGYRQATESTERAAVTEELRQALLGYRAIFHDLLGGPPSSSANRAGRRDAAGGGGAGRPWRRAVPSLHWSLHWPLHRSPHRSPHRGARQRDGGRVAAARP